MLICLRDAVQNSRQQIEGFRDRPQIKRFSGGMNILQIRSDADHVQRGNLHGKGPAFQRAMNRLDLDLGAVLLQIYLLRQRQQHTVRIKGPGIRESCRSNRKNGPHFSNADRFFVVPNPVRQIPNSVFSKAVL